VIPGGGAGSDATSVIDKPGYPTWTSNRVEDAHRHYTENFPNPENSGGAIFFALSAGSLNNANKATADGRIIFECQHMIEHLKELGVDSTIIFGDFISWDTLTNALSLRLFIEGLLAAQANRDEDEITANTLKKDNKINKKLLIEVFISDFHAERVKTAFSWVLDLSPSLTPKIEMHIHSVSTLDIKWPSKEAFQARISHEKQGVLSIKQHAEHIHSIQEFYAFLLLGGHAGLDAYLKGSYAVSKGAGW